MLASLAHLILRMNTHKYRAMRPGERRCATGWRGGGAGVRPWGRHRQSTGSTPRGAASSRGPPRRSPTAAASATSPPSPPSTRPLPTPSPPAPPPPPPPPPPCPPARPSPPSAAALVRPPPTIIQRYPVHLQTTRMERSPPPLDPFPFPSLPRPLDAVQAGGAARVGHRPGAGRQHPRRRRPRPGRHQGLRSRRQVDAAVRPPSPPLPPAALGPKRRSHPPSLPPRGHLFVRMSGQLGSGCMTHPQSRPLARGG